MRHLYINKGKFALANIPKTGTSSFARLIFDIDFPHMLDKISKSVDPVGDNVKYKNTVWEYKRRTRKPTQDTSEYDFIAFVRNPYDRVFSSYRHYRRFRKLWKTCPEIRSMSFRRFLRSSLFKSFVKSDGHFLPMKYYIDRMDSRHKLYRFEMFEKELKNLLLSKGIKIDIPNYNPPGDKRKYEDQYNDKSKSIIEKYYKWDLKNLNYTFDGYGDLPSISELI
jgi:hypothetical protein